MKKHLFSLIFICSISIGFAQENLSIQLQNVPASVSPNTHFSLFFELKSTVVPLSDSVEINLTLPNGWNTIIAKKPQKISGEYSAKYIYTIATAHTTASGNYPITINAYYKGASIAEKDIVLKVAQVRKIAITPIDIPEYSLEGDSLKIDYLIQNSGNNIEKLWVEKPKRKKGPKGDSLTVLPNESIKVSIAQKVPVGDGNAWTIAPRIRVFMKDSLRPITEVTSVPVYAKKNKKSDPYLRFPLEVSVGYNRFSNSNIRVGMFQFDARGRGFLDFKKKHHLDFVIHGPNQVNIPFISNFSQYSLTYIYKKTTAISVGDYSLTFNNLMELGRFGRGIKVDKDFTKVSFSAFFLQPRFFPIQRNTYGGRFTYKVSPKFGISLDYLSKNTFVNKQWLWMDFAGTSLRYKTDALNLETEVAMSVSDSKVDFGAFNRFEFRYKRLQLNNNLIYAGKNFYGFFNNSWQFINAINYSLSKRINLGLVSNITRVNPNYDVLVLNTSPYYSNQMAMLSYQLSKKQRLMISYNLQSKEDRQPQKQFHFRENYVRLSYAVNSEKFNLFYNGNFGYSQNLLNKADSNLSARSISNLVQPQVQVLPWIWLGAMAEHQQTNKFSTDNKPVNYFFYGGSVRATIGKYVDAFFMYRNNYAPDELVERRSFMDLSVNCNIGKGKLSFTGGRAFIPNYTQSNQNTLFFRIKYTHRLNAPLAKNRNLGHIKGQISGLAGAVRKDGILVQLGNKKYISDANGFFYFNDLMPDTYYLTIDKASVSAGAITAIKTPIELTVKADSTKLVDIPLIKSGGIEGALQFVSLQDEEKAKQQNKVILVKIYNETENFLTQANGKFSFSFKEIKPGNWTIKAWFPDAQNQLNIENAEQSITIEEGNIKKMAFKVLPHERKIQFSGKSYQIVLKE